ncbi:MAG: CHAT domain-containing protein [Deltaproteobacteria bacterium]|nr:CHAT domain-containing protein [Deltaproteobacteria bacterium]
MMRILLTLSVALAGLTGLAPAPGSAAERPRPRALLDSGQAIEAVRLCERVLFGAASSPPELRDEAFEAWTDALLALGDFPELAVAWQRKRDLAAKQHGQGSAQAALCTAELAETLFTLGRADEATAQWTQAMAAARGLVQAGDLGAWDVLARAADIAKSQGERQAVADVALASIPAMQGRVDRDDQGQRDRARRFLIALAGMRIEMGHPGDAVGMATAAVQLVHPDRAINDPQTGEIAAVMGRAYLASGQLEKARQFLGYAIEKLAPVYGENAALTAHLHNRLGYTLLRLGDRAGALDELRKGRGPTTALRQSVRRSALPVRVKLEAYNRAFFDDELLFGLVVERALAGDAAAVREVVTLELGRKGALLDALAPRKTIASEPPQASQLRTLAGQLAALDRLLVAAPTRELQQRVSALAALRDQLEAQLAARQDTGASGPRDLAQLCAELPADAALVDYIHYVRTDSRPGGYTLTGKFVALAVSPVGCVARVVDLGEALPIGQQVQAFRAVLHQSARGRGAVALGDDPTAPAADWAPAARALYDRLLAPVAATVGRAKVLVVSPDDALHFLPFAALVADDGQLIGERHDLALVDSPRVHRRPPSATGPRSALILGNPAFSMAPASPVRTAAAWRGADATCRAALSQAWPALPGTQVESDLTAQVVQAAGGVVVRKQAGEAREKAFRELAPRHTWLAIATHGYFAPAACAKDGDGQRRDPLLLSGLVLAGANDERADPADDGWLSAAELAALDLSRVQLAVLSACETGLGDAQQAIGDGVFGLRRALALAGVHGALMSLWQVADRETADLMGHFWRDLAGCKGPTCQPYRVLARAQAAMRAQLTKAGRPAHPYYWAGFVYGGGL